MIDTNAFDLILINQDLIYDCMIALTNKVVLLTENFDVLMLKTAFVNGARGYLSVDTSPILLEMLLQANEDMFLIEPAFIPQVMRYVLDSKHPPIRDELLTPREKEVVILMREGLDRCSIAQKLYISELTLKTHLQNIERKRGN